MLGDEVGGIFLGKEGHKRLRARRASNNQRVQRGRGRGDGGGGAKPIQGLACFKTSCCSCPARALLQSRLGLVLTPLASCRPCRHAVPLALVFGGGDRGCVGAGVGLGAWCVTVCPNRSSPDARSRMTQRSRPHQAGFQLGFLCVSARHGSPPQPFAHPLTPSFPPWQDKPQTNPS